MSIAGVVTYNPDIERLKDNLSGITPQVDTVLLWDNGSDNFEQIKNLCSKLSDSIQIDSSGENLGIAYALNKLAEKAMARGEENILFLDQDSVVGEGFYRTLAQYCNDDVAVISPTIADVHLSNRLTSSQRIPTKEVYLLPITSGALTNLRVWEKIGKFDERLFIDLVDTDFDIRAALNGYCSYRINGVVLSHEIGHTAPTGIPFPHIDNGRLVIRQGHRSGYSITRSYYQVRNRIYVTAKYAEELKDMRLQLQSVSYAIFRMLVFEPHRIQRIKAIFAGIRDSKKLLKP